MSENKLVNDFILSIMKTFYTPIDYFVMWTLLTMEKLKIKDDEIAKKLHIHVSIVRKSLQSLQSEFLVQMQSSGREKHPKWEVSVNYSQLLDVLNYRLHSLTLKLREQHALNVDYVCDHCEAIYTAYEIVDLQNKELCTVCKKGRIIEQPKALVFANLTQEKLETQMKPFMDRMREIQDQLVFLLDKNYFVRKSYYERCLRYEQGQKKNNEKFDGSNGNLSVNPFLPGKRGNEFPQELEIITVDLKNEEERKKEEFPFFLL